LRDRLTILNLPFITEPELKKIIGRKTKPTTVNTNGPTIIDSARLNMANNLTAVKSWEQNPIRIDNQESSEKNSSDNVTQIYAFNQPRTKLLLRVDEWSGEGYEERTISATGRRRAAAAAAESGRRGRAAAARRGNGEKERYIWGS
jgi:hypothetical protein